MASLLNFLRRNYATFNPPVVPKSDDALRVGILGAVNIAPLALINPAKSHPEVKIQAVAARDQNKAAAYAKKHNIPDVKVDYQAILDDLEIDCVYIPLPNGLHYEWAVKALNAGKHVLLEKPSVSNAHQAQQLFNLPILHQPNAPIILEAFHYRFHPSWQLFLSLLDQPNVRNARATNAVPWFVFPADDIRFQQTFGAEATECSVAEFKMMPAPEKYAEHGWNVKWIMPNGGIAESEGDLRAGLGQLGIPRIKVQHDQIAIEDPNVAENHEKLRTREVEFLNFMGPSIWHRIDVKDQFILRDAATGEIKKRWTEKTSRKAYTYQDAAIEGVGEGWWTTYRHQLEQFVNRVKGRKTNVWVDGEDSISQAKMIDMTYEKGTLPARGLE